MASGHTEAELIWDWIFQVSACAQSWTSPTTLCTKTCGGRELDSQKCGQSWFLRGNCHFVLHCWPRRNLPNILWIQETRSGQGLNLLVSANTKSQKPVTRSTSYEPGGKVRPNFLLHVTFLESLDTKFQRVSLCSQIELRENRSTGVLTHRLKWRSNHCQIQQDNLTPEKTWWREARART